MFYDQADYDVRFEWGLNGVEALTTHCDAVVIIDVLSFTTCVDVAVAREAIIYPFHGDEEAAAERAAGLGAQLAARRKAAAGGYTLSAQSLLGIGHGERLVLPSPNGSTLSHRAAELAPDGAIFAGCLRNAAAVAVAAVGVGRRVGVIAAGERWPPDGTLRPALEDMLGAGAVIARLPGRRSPEAAMAAAAYEWARPDMAALVRGCSSGRQLAEWGRERDLELAGEVDVSACAPRLIDGGYRAV